MIDDLNKLRSKGIKLMINGIERLVYFQCVMVVGDNLGLNSIYSFITCFKSDYCCRICKASKQEIKNLEEEEESLLRTPENDAIEQFFYF